MKKSIELSGFLTNDEKSNWDPSQLSIWLGLQIDTKNYTLSITEKRISKATDRLKKLCKKVTASAREVSTVAGCIISQNIVMGSVTGLFSREMYHFIATCPTWDRKVRIPTGVFNEIKFWQENLSSLNLKHLGKLGTPVCASVNSDASSVACGAILKIDDNIYTSHKNFDDNEINQSSTWRELEAVHHALESFAPLLSGRGTRWETDNQAVPTISSKGSKSRSRYFIPVR